VKLSGHTLVAVLILGGFFAAYTVVKALKTEKIFVLHVGPVKRETSPIGYWVAVIWKVFFLLAFVWYAVKYSDVIDMPF
jgi:hypothetical protein